MLRGFGPAEEMSFLETWVPDEDHHASIVGLFVSAKESGIPKVTVVVSQDSVPDAELSKLEKALSDIGMLELERSADGIEVTVSFGNNCKKELTPSTGEDVHPVYRSQIVKLSKSSSFEGELEPASDCSLISANWESRIKLMCLIDNQSHVVKAARYLGASSATERALLEGLCSTIEGKPILESSDHAVLYLENQLRDHSMTPPVQGLVSSVNCDPSFAMPLYLVREIFAGYRAATGYDSVENFYLKSSSPGWRSLSDQERRDAISQALKSFESELVCQLVDLEGDRRVVVGIVNQPPAGVFGHLLMQLETHLQEQVESTIEVHLPAKADLNSIREIKRVEA